MSSVLVHDVLAALLGHTGDIIQPVYSDKRTLLTFHTARTLSFISPSERQRIDAVVHLGSLYHILLAFAESPAPIHPSSAQPLYLTALRGAVSILLASYRSTVLRAEQTALASSSYPLSSLQLALQPFALLFPAIARTVTAVTTARAPHGCQLLSLLHDEAQTGYPLLAAAYRNTQQSLHGVLYAQVEGFCAYGRLHDPNEEFFIGRSARSNERSGAADDDPYTQAWEEWVVRSAMVPSYLPTSTVHTVHFLGRAVNVLQLSPSPVPLFLTPPFTAFLAGLTGLHTSRTFSLAALDGVLAPLHAHVTERLSSVLLASSDVEAHLRALHAFVLLSDGSFSHFLLTHAEPLLSVPPTSHVSRDLASLLQHALASASLTSHPQTPLLSLTLDPAAFHFPSSSRAAAFHCIGDVTATLTAIKGSRGAVWHTKKMLVEHGFDASLSLAWTPSDPTPDPTRLGWGFVLQNESLSMSGERRRSHNVEPDAPVLTGLVNSLLVEVTGYGAGAGGRKEQLAVYHFPHPPGTASYPPPPRCMKAVTGSWGLFDGKPHGFAFAYSVEGEQATLSVTVDGQAPPALVLPLKLHSTLLLDIGRAWLGVVCGGGGGVAVDDWAFRERLPVSQPLLAWRDLRLGYRVTGPLSLILRPACFDRYASLFRFLLQLARTNLALQRSWQGLGSLRSERPPLRPALAKLLALRRSLHFFTSTLLHHLYQSVIHPAHAALMAAVRGTTDFLQVRRAHDQFLARVVQGCWVRDRVLMQGLRDVSDLADRVLLRVAEGWDGVQDGWVGEEAEEWGRLAGLLLTVWTRKNHVVDSHALSSLLLQLDHNGHFSRLAIAVGVQRAA